MNAIVGICHFCEAHGPRPIFCTFTTDNEKNTTESSKANVECNGCTSLGPETVLVTKDDDGTIFCSRETVPNIDVTSFLRQAAVRSITCEVNWSKEGGVVYFSDTQGHVLSLTFQLRDTRARGLKRWFSIVVLMKDKMLLLNITPLLSEHMQNIAKELQQLADVVFDDEQKVCSQRALRLQTGRNDFGQSRSLKQLTGNEDVFKTLHSHFAWMLKAGAHTYTETLYTSQDLLRKLNPKTINGTSFEDGACVVPNNEDCISLRALENLLTKNVFRILLYCTLIGVNIAIRTIHTDASIIMKGLARLMPVTNTLSHIRIFRGEDPSSNVCVLEEVNQSTYSCIWAEVLPMKCPTLMNKIENAMCNDKFNDGVLHQHVKSLVLEWLSTAKAIKATMSSAGHKSEAVTKLKQVLGVAQHDEQLLNFWMYSFCD
ncbi:folliculin isoform X2 [Manduca sexta]|uniref:folliculin isoform X2 n=1 Tax=Manduca sexta TaxID=7130 RepID=UPI0011845180|nr:folliculin isoform X2 [Manduca sexta]